MKRDKPHNLTLSTMQGEKVSCNVDSHCPNGVDCHDCNVGTSMVVMRSDGGLEGWMHETSHDAFLTSHHMTSRQNFRPSFTRTSTRTTTRLQCRPPSMSLLRAAKGQIANQQKHQNLNAFISLASASSVLPRVEAAQARDPDRYSVLGRLVAIKDNVCTTELPTTAASGILKQFSSPYDATVVKLLHEAGAIVAGKTNMDEFGMGSHTTHSYFGKAKMSGNSDIERSAGGSSGGSAIAVATQQCWA